jgi:hypothetical protein
LRLGVGEHSVDLLVVEGKLDATAFDSRPVVSGCLNRSGFAGGSNS